MPGGTGSLRSGALLSFTRLLQPLLLLAIVLSNASLTSAIPAPDPAVELLEAQLNTTTPGSYHTLAISGLVRELRKRDGGFTTKESAECWTRLFRGGTIIPGRRGMYKIESFLGAGTTSGVFLAISIDRSPPIPVAVKLMPSLTGPELCNAIPVRDPQREIALMKSISDEDDAEGFVVRYIDDISKSGRTFIVMEYSDAGDLFNWLNALEPEGGGTNQKDIYETRLKGVQKLINATGYSVSWLHGKGYAHRDVQPDNIFASSKSLESAAFKLGDFGLATRATETREVYGMDWFVPPEMLKLSIDYVWPQDHDVYSVGMTAVVALSFMEPSPFFNSHKDAGIILKKRMWFGKGGCVPCDKKRLKKLVKKREVPEELLDVLEIALNADHTQRNIEKFLEAWGKLDLVELLPYTS